MRNQSASTSGAIDAAALHQQVQSLNDDRHPPG